MFAPAKGKIKDDTLFGDSSVIKVDPDEKSAPYCHARTRLAGLREQNENAYCTRGTEPPLNIGKRASGVSYFTEDSAVFRGKCAVSILSLPPPREQAENIYRLREHYEIE